MSTKIHVLKDALRSQMVVALRNGYTASEIADALREAEEQVAEEQVAEERRIEKESA